MSARHPNVINAGDLHGSPDDGEPFRQLQRSGESLPYDDGEDG